MDEKRKHPRLSTDLVTRLRLSRISRQAEASLLRRIKDISLGGVFIETDAPFPLGTIVEFEFELPVLAHRIQAKGIVRWSSAGGGDAGRRGIGVEFLSIAVRDAEAIVNYIGAESARAVMPALTKTPLHRDLLRLLQQRSGQVMLFEALKNNLSCEAGPLQDALRDFESSGLTRFNRASEVEFLQAPDDALRRLIEEWAAKSGPQA